MRAAAALGRATRPGEYGKDSGDAVARPMEVGQEDAEALSVPVNRRAVEGGQSGAVHGALDSRTR